MIKTKNLGYSYPDGTRALEHINFSTDAGNIIGILGENGAGKTTLFSLLMGLIKPTEGFLSYQEEAYPYSKKFLYRLRQDISMVFQDPSKQIFHNSVQEDIGFTLFNYKVPKELIAQRTKQVMEEMNLWELREKPVHFLSYGQKKRVALAGAIVNDCKVLLLDEPLAGLDPKMQQEMMKILQKVAKNRTLIISSHNLEFLYNICDYYYVISKGKILIEGSREQVMREEVLEQIDFILPLSIKVREYFLKEDLLTRDEFLKELV